MVKGKQKAVRDKLAGSMRDYTMARQDEKVEKLQYENSIRSLLGKDVKPVPDPSETNRGDTRFESQPQKLDRKIHFVNVNIDVSYKTVCYQIMYCFVI